MPGYKIEDKYKIRLFWKDMLTDNGLIGKIEIRKGTKDYILEQIEINLSKLRKVIIELC